MPKRRPAESRPLLVEPPAFLVAMPRVCTAVNVVVGPLKLVAVAELVVVPSKVLLRERNQERLRVAFILSAWIRIRLQYYWQQTRVPCQGGSVHSTQSIDLL
jgi:hypothetical protein